MHKELELWQFVRERLEQSASAMLLVVAESSGSSPGRQGYKMAVGADGELCGSIGGGVMEVALADAAKLRMTHGEWRIAAEVVEQVHQKNSPNASGMICSGKQTVIFQQLSVGDLPMVDSIVVALEKRETKFLTLTQDELTINLAKDEFPREDFRFEKKSDSDFLYEEKLGCKNDLYIIGGGHCALALSELMSKMDFHISIFDDRPDLNTIEKNRFAHEISIIDSYDTIGDAIPCGENIFIVVMTLGYESDAVVIRQLIDRDFKYFGVLGSKAKMATLIKELRSEGFASDKLDRIHTPIGLPINSRTPEEIAVSIAAEIISVKNS